MPAFLRLMQITAKAFRRTLDEDTIELYRLMLMDMDIETIGRRMSEHAKHEKFFPAIAEIRQDPKPEEKAQADYAMIEEMISHFIYPGMESTGRTIVAMKLEEKGRGELVPFLDRWGSKILNSTNPTATQAQLIKQLTVEHKRGLKELQQSPDEKRISDGIGKLIGGIG